MYLNFLLYIPPRFANFRFSRSKINWIGFLLNDHKFRDQFLFVKIFIFIVMRDLFIIAWSERGQSSLGFDAQPSIWMYWAILKHFNRTEYHLYYVTKMTLLQLIYFCILCFPYCCLVHTLKIRVVTLA